MALINRITRLFRADLHSVLDRIEDPEALLRQAVREMEADISNDERRQALLQHEQGQLTRRNHNLSEALERLESELDICFDSNEETLARTLIKRKLEAQSIHKVLKNKCESSSAALNELKQRLAENQQRLASMQQKLELLVGADSGSRRQVDEGRAYADDYSATQVPVSEEDVEVALLSEKQRRMPS